MISFHKNAEKKVRDWIGKHQLYLGYRYKKRTIVISEKTGKRLVFQPYVKKKDCVEHPFALNYKEWSEIVDVYFKCMTLRLIEGETFEMPRGLGDLLMMKQKTDSKKKWGLVYRNIRTMGFRPWLGWFRKGTSTFQNKFWFSSINLSRKKLWPLMGKRLKDKPETIFKYPTAR
jgi:hypothetical protein